MREIKFRAWYQGKMHHLGDIYGAYFIDGAYLEHSGHNGDEPVFMQYTGIRDKSGAEIYEGDILKSEENEVCAVEWSRGRVSFELNPRLSWSWVGYEVIGNVYENPELLK